MFDRVIPAFTEPARSSVVAPVGTVSSLAALAALAQREAKRCWSASDWVGVLWMDFCQGEGAQDVHAVSAHRDRLARLARPYLRASDLVTRVGQTELAAVLHTADPVALDKVCRRLHKAWDEAGVPSSRDGGLRPIIRTHALRGHSANMTALLRAVQTGEAFSPA